MEDVGFEWAVGLDFVSQFCFDFVEHGLVGRVDDDVGGGESVPATVLGGGLFALWGFGSRLIRHGESSFLKKI